MTHDYVSIAMDIQSKWTEYFVARDLDSLISLYASKTAFWGSTNELYEDPAGVRAYFTKLPPSYKNARYRKPHIVALGQDAFAASGFVVFTREDAGQDVELPYRMTHVFIRQDGAWKIATHHASPEFKPA